MKGVEDLLLPQNGPRFPPVLATLSGRHRCPTSPQSCRKRGGASTRGRRSRRRSGGGPGPLHAGHEMGPEAPRSPADAGQPIMRIPLETQAHIARHSPHGTGSRSGGRRAGTRRSQSVPGCASEADVCHPAGDDGQTWSVLHTCGLGARQRPLRPTRSTRLFLDDRHQRLGEGCGIEVAADGHLLGVAAAEGDEGLGDRGGVARPLVGDQVGDR